MVTALCFESSRGCRYRLIVSGTPLPMRCASQVMALVLSRMQPCETAVPSEPERPFVPWRAIWPGPPSNSWSTFDRALVASANGPPACDEIASASSMKKRPVGVGVEGFPTTAGKRR